MVLNSWLLEELLTVNICLTQKNKQLNTQSVFLQCNQVDNNVPEYTDIKNLMNF